MLLSKARMRLDILYRKRRILDDSRQALMNDYVMSNEEEIKIVKSAIDLELLKLDKYIRDYVMAIEIAELTTEVEF